MSMCLGGDNISKLDRSQEVWLIPALPLSDFEMAISSLEPEIPHLEKKESFGLCDFTP